jgi:chorismate--pyruvate lyase
LVNKSILYSDDPQWVVNHPGVRHRIPTNVQSWIYEPGSLTQRIKDHYGDAFAVKVLFHQWRLPFLSECRLLQQPHNKYCLTREVLLTGDKQPLILARTIIPAQTLKGTQRALSRLGNRPLGEVIFSYPKLQRLEMDIACVEISNWSSTIIDQTRIKGPQWGRRTIYAIQHRQMLVSEFFLPDVLSII